MSYGKDSSKIETMLVILFFNTIRFIYLFSNNNNVISHLFDWLSYANANTLIHMVLEKNLGGVYIFMMLEKILGEMYFFL